MLSTRWLWTRMRIRMRVRVRLWLGTLLSLRRHVVAERGRNRAALTTRVTTGATCVARGCCCWHSMVSVLEFKQRYNTIRESKYYNTYKYFWIHIFYLSLPTHSRFMRHVSMNKVTMILLRRRVKQWLRTCIWLMHKMKAESGDSLI